MHDGIFDYLTVIGFIVFGVIAVAVFAGAPIPVWLILVEFIATGICAKFAGDRWQNYNDHH